MNENIRRVSRDLLREIAELHKECFADHFLGNYPVFVIEKFYSYFLEAPFFVFRENGQIHGFLLGGDIRDLAGYKKRFLSENIPLLIFGTLLSPRIWPEAFSRVFSMGLSRFRDRKKMRGEDTAEADSGICILSIAVSPKMRGSGTARELAAFFEESLDSSVSAYWLAVKKDNPRAIHFYEKQGFGYYKEEGDLLYMIKRLDR